MVKLLPYILFEKYINILALEMASQSAMQGTGTVPIASTHLLLLILKTAVYP